MNFKSMYHNAMERLGLRRTTVSTGFLLYTEYKEARKWLRENNIKFIDNTADSIEPVLYERDILNIRSQSGEKFCYQFTFFNNKDALRFKIVWG